MRPVPIKNMSERIASLQAMASRVAIRKINEDSDIDGFKEYIKTAPVKAVKMDEAFEVETLEGTMTGKEGDWLAKGPEGEVWPIDAKIFSKTYKPVKKTARFDYRQKAKQVLAAFDRNDLEPFLGLLQAVVADTGRTTKLNWDSTEVPVPSFHDKPWYQALGPRIKNRAWTLGLGIGRMLWAMKSWKDMLERMTPEQIAMAKPAWRTKTVGYLKDIVWLGQLQVQEASGDDAGDTFQHAGFTIIPMATVSKTDIKEVLAALDDAVRLCKPQFSQVLYGKLYITSSLSSARLKKTIAHYVSETDVMTVSMYAKGPSATRTILHELGHRYDHKFLGMKRSRFQGLSNGILQVETELTKSKAVVLADEIVTQLDKPGRQGFNETNEIGHRTGLMALRGQLPNLTFAMNAKRDLKPFDAVAVLKEIIGLAPITLSETINLGKQLNVSAYGATSIAENFAEGFAEYLMGKQLPHEAMKQFYDDLI